MNMMLYIILHIEGYELITIVQLIPQLSKLTVSLFC